MSTGPGWTEKEVPRPCRMPPAGSLGPSPPQSLQPDFCSQRPLAPVRDWEGPEPRSLEREGQRQGSWLLGPQAPWSLRMGLAGRVSALGPVCACPPDDQGLAQP